MELIETRAGDVRVAAISGRVDHAAAETFRKLLWPQLETCSDGRDHLILDLSGLDYISSAGLRVLMLAARDVKSRNGRMVVAGLRPVVREIFEISRFTLVFQVFADLESARLELEPGSQPASPPSPNHAERESPLPLRPITTP